MLAHLSVGHSLPIVGGVCGQIKDAQQPVSLSVTAGYHEYLNCVICPLCARAAEQPRVMTQI